MIRLRTIYWPLAISMWCLLIYTLVLTRSEWKPTYISSPHLEAPQPRRQSGGRPRVAIIGAGAAGSSCAYFLKFLADKEASLAVDIDLYEANDYVGGRVHSVQPWLEKGASTFGDRRSLAIETGASIFVPANKNLRKAVRTFDLPSQSGHGGGEASEEAEDVINIYDGEKIVYMETATSTWRESLQLFWRYGYRSYETYEAVDVFVARFLELYKQTFQAKGPYTTIESFAKALGLGAFARLTTFEYLSRLGISKRFAQEMVASASTVNYAQGSSSMHAFQGMISMATSGGMSVVGGNNQVFQQFAARSNASINLRTQVISITKQHDPSDTSGAAASQRWLLRSKNLDHGRMSRKTYDAIIFAAPLHQKRPSEVAEVVISGSNISSLVPPLAYVHLYVTLVVTNATNPIPAFFNSKTRVSKTIITTLDPYETGQTATKPKVNSLTYLQSLGKLDNQTGIGHVVKIFSPNDLSDSDLRAAFGQNEVIWVHRKEWASYPFAPPFGKEERLPAFKPEEDSFFYYTSAMERLVSTMETSTVSAWNVITLLMQDLFGYKVTQSWAEWQD